MKAAFCHYSFHRRVKEEGWDLDRFADEVKAFGIEGIDFHAKQVGPIETVAGRILATLKRTGLTLTSMSLSTNFNQPKQEDFDAQVAYTRSWLEVAGKIKAPLCRIFGGSIPMADRGDPKARAACTQRMIDGVAAATKEAARRGVILALENHGGLPCTGQEQVEVIRQINSPFLRATIDVGNYMQGGEDPVHGVTTAAAYCAYVHLKDNKKVPDAAFPWGYRAQPCVVGEGDVDLVGCIEALRKSGYDGYVALEYEGAEDEKTGVPRSVATLKRVVK